MSALLRAKFYNCNVKGYHSVIFKRKEIKALDPHLVLLALCTAFSAFNLQ